MTTDGELFRRAVDEPEAFGEVFERHGASVWRYVRSRLGEASAEEVVAETFLVAYRRRERFDPSYGSARPWLLGIATNLIRRRRRDEQTHLSALQRFPAPDPEDVTADLDRLDAQRLRPVLVEALLTLSVEDRDTFLLVAVGELTYTEAATALGIPVGTVRSRIHRARAILRERIGSLPAIPDGDDEADDDG